MPQPGGAVAISWLGDVTVTPAAAFAPKFTVAPGEKSVPVTVTLVGPPVCSVAGLMPTTDGPAKVSLPANVPHAQPASLAGMVAVPIAAYSAATQMSVGFWGSMAAPE